MTPEEEAIRLIEGIERMPREAGPLALSAEYLRLVQRVESHPRNQSGADKSWVARTLQASRDLYARAIRVR